MIGNYTKEEVSVSSIHSAGTKGESAVNARIDRCYDKHSTLISGSSCGQKQDIRVFVDQLLKQLHKTIIYQGIWIQIEGDQNQMLPTFCESACQMVEAVIRDAIRRHHNHNKGTVTYVKIGFSTSGTKTTITIEDNATCPSAEDTENLSFLHRCRNRVLPGGYTIQAMLKDTLGTVSIRCVNRCFIRFSLCFYDQG